jgi:hypothetical protein
VRVLLVEDERYMAEAIRDGRCQLWRRAGGMKPEP